MSDYSRLLNSSLHRWVAVCFVLSVLLGSSDLRAAAQTSVTQTTSGADLPAPGDVVVVLKRSQFRSQEATFSAAAEVANDASVEPDYVYDQVLGGFAATVNAEQLQTLAKDPAVAYIVENTAFHAHDQEVSTAIERSAIDEYPPASIGSGAVKNVDIAILDSGIDYNHSDLRVMGGYNCVNNNSNYMDYFSHGTHVAGIAGAYDNSFGTVGAAAGARLWGYKVLNDAGNGTLGSILCGLNLVTSDIEVVNMSLGGSGSSSSCYDAQSPDALHDAICDVVNMGIPVVVSAGNDNVNAGDYIPANYPEVITVGAMSDYDGEPGGLAGGYPGCGTLGADDSAASYSNYGSVVDIAAPGTCIRSTVPGGGYVLKSGTSMAAPLVTGVVALYRLQNPSASPSQIANWLLSSGGSKSSADMLVGFNEYKDLGGRLLYPGSFTASPGVINPTFPGVQAPIVSSTASMNAGYAPKTYDASSSSNWSSGSAPIGTATLTLNLGQEMTLTGVKWMFAYTGYADYFTVEAVPSSGPATVLGAFGNGTASHTWFGADGASAVASSIRFTFYNPNDDGQVGSVSWIQVYHVPVSHSPGALNPTFSGTQQSIASATANMNSGFANRVLDTDNMSNWSSGTTPTGSATLTLDLGSQVRLTGVKWMVAYTGYADQFTVQVAPASGGWQSIGTFGNPGASKTWYGIPMGGGLLVRYVRFVFDNPNFDGQVGSISWVQIYRSTVSNPVGIPSPNFSGCEQTIVGSSATMNNGAAFKMHDANLSSNWSSLSQPMDTVILTFDLGSDVNLTGVKWHFAFSGYADEFQVRAFSSTWQSTFLGTFGSSGSSHTYYGAEAPGSTQARWIRMYLTNPNGDNQVGSFGDVEIWGDTACGTEIIATPTFDATPEPDTGTPASEATPLMDQNIQSRTSQPESLESTPLATTSASTPVLEESPESEPTSTEPATAIPTSVPTEAPTSTPTLEPTATEEAQPLPIVAFADSEQSTASELESLIDNDLETWWSVVPSQSPAEVWLWLDVGSVQALDHLSTQLATWDQLDTFEIWLSVDNDAWYNVTGPIDGSNLPRGEDLEIDLGYNARYVRLVVPNLDVADPNIVGGLAYLEIWAHETGATRQLAEWLPAVTPTPAPATETPTMEPSPTATEEPTATATETSVPPTETATEVPPTETPVPTETPTEVPPTETPTVEPTETPPPTATSAPTEEPPMNDASPEG